MRRTEAMNGDSLVEAEGVGGPGGERAGAGTAAAGVRRAPTAYRAPRLARERPPRRGPDRPQKRGTGTAAAVRHGADRHSLGAPSLRDGLRPRSITPWRALTARSAPAVMPTMP